MDKMKPEDLNKLLLQSYITAQMTIGYLQCIPNGKNKSFNKQRAHAIDALNKMMAPIDGYLRKDESLGNVMDEITNYIEILENAISDEKRESI